MSATVVIEHCKVSPPPKEDDDEFSLPIVFFDLLFYAFPPYQFLLFFEIPNCSRSHFLETIVPRLKKSLSLTTKHFLPLSGHIVHPLNPVNKPVLRYKPGDSISFTIAESVDDFNHLIGKQPPRASDDFYPLVPQLPPHTETDDSVMCPVIALQATLFPGSGMSLGVTFHHAVTDASTNSMFLRAWACLTRYLESSSSIDDSEAAAAKIEARLKECDCLPCYDRTTVADIDGLDSFYWDIVKVCTPWASHVSSFPTNKLRAMFVLKKEQVQKLKSHAMSKLPDLTRLSSFAVTSGFVWMCASRAEDYNENMKEEEEEEEVADQTEILSFVADCRERLSPPLPGNYFGNCWALLKAELSRRELTGDNGFVLAVEAIAKAVRDRVYAEKGILSKAKDWEDEFVKDFEGKRVYSVAGSPRFDIYNVDFGWGNPKAHEPLFLDNDRSISLCRSVEFEDGIEIGISKTKTQMDAFVRLFNGALQEFTS